MCHVKLNSDGGLDLGNHPDVSAGGVEVFHDIERIGLSDLDLLRRDPDTRLRKIAYQKRFCLINSCFQSIASWNRPEYLKPRYRDLSPGGIRRQNKLGS